MSHTPSKPSVVPVVFGLVLLKLVVHSSLITRYGYHSDELYFRECGRHLAFGYVDHPPLVPWIAALSGLFGDSIVALRLPSIAAATGAMLLVALIVHEWGGGRLGARRV